MIWVGWDGWDELLGKECWADGGWFRWAVEGEKADETGALSVVAMSDRSRRRVAGGVKGIKNDRSKLFRCSIKLLVRWLVAMSEPL